MTIPIMRRVDLGKWCHNVTERLEAKGRLRKLGVKVVSQGCHNVTGGCSGLGVYGVGGLPVPVCPCAKV